MRYCIDKVIHGFVLKDRDGEMDDIFFRQELKPCFEDLCNHLNAKEIEKLEYKKKYNNLRFKVRKLSESI